MVRCQGAVSRREEAVTRREDPASRRETALDAHERMDTILGWIAILTLAFAAIGALGAWGGSVLQVLVEHALGERRGRRARPACARGRRRLLS